MLLVLTPALILPRHVWATDRLERYGLEWLAGSLRPGQSVAVATAVLRAAGLRPDVASPLPGGRLARVVAAPPDSGCSPARTYLACPMVELVLPADAGPEAPVLRLRSYRPLPHPVPAAAVLRAAVSRLGPPTDAADRSDSIRGREVLLREFHWTRPPRPGDAVTVAVVLAPDPAAPERGAEPTMVLGVGVTRDDPRLAGPFAAAPYVVAAAGPHPRRRPRRGAVPVAMAAHPAGLHAPG